MYPLKIILRELRGCEVTKDYNVIALFYIQSICLDVEG